MLQQDLPENLIFNHLTWNNSETIIQGIAKYPKQIEKLVKIIEKNNRSGQVLLDEIQEDKTRHLLLFTINVKTNLNKND